MLMRYSFSCDQKHKILRFSLLAKDELGLICYNTYVQLWHIHNAEQMILDHEEENPDKFKEKKFEETVDHSFDEENSVQYTKAYYKESFLPKVILVMALLYNINSHFC